jgi:hypothetical protein
MLTLQRYTYKFMQLYKVCDFLNCHNSKFWLASKSQWGTGDKVVKTEGMISDIWKYGKMFIEKLWIWLCDTKQQQQQQQMFMKISTDSEFKSHRQSYYRNTNCDRCVLTSSGYEWNHTHNRYSTQTLNTLTNCKNKQYSSYCHLLPTSHMSMSCW